MMAHHPPLPRQKDVCTMAIEQEARSEAITPKRAATNLIRTSKEEEGTSKGEIWAVARALFVLIGAIVLIGYVIA